MEQTWRWFGPRDPVPLQHVRQAGATGVVSALHHLPNGTAWPVAEIEKRKAEIEAAGLAWSVVESVPVSEGIKTRSGDWRAHLQAYAETIRNLTACDGRTVCLNFTSGMDWTRTDLASRLPDGSLSLRFDATEFAAFDLFILRRQDAEAEYTAERIAQAKAAHDMMDQAAQDRLTKTIIAGLPGAEESYTLDMLRTALGRYRGMSKDELRSQVGAFL